MGRKQGNWGKVWADTVDYLVPLLRLKVTEQALYFYLMRHSHLKGSRLVTLLKKTLGEGIQRSEFNLNEHLGRLARKGCVAFRGRESGGVVLEVFRPEEIVEWLTRGAWKKVDLDQPLMASKDPAKRRALLRRDRGRCFYCRERLSIGVLHVDHLEPISGGGSTRMENCVASCERCNREKGSAPAARYLYMLYRLHRLSRKQYKERVRALRKLQLAAAEAM
jgi:hypothetical protein